MALMEVIKFTPYNTDWLIFKSPITDFNTKSRLIVGPGQTAIFVYGGKVEAEFESGTYTLDTSNLPFIQSLNKSIYGGSSPYQAEVYFFNRTLKLDTHWGLSDGIQMVDPKFNIVIVVQARGQMGLRLVNKQFCLTQLIGSFSSNLIKYADVMNFFKGIVNTKIKPIIANYLTKNQISALDLALAYEDVANHALSSLKDEFSIFGFELINLSIESLEPRKQDFDAINGFLHKKAEIDIIGTDLYKTSRSFDVLEKAADNEGGVSGLGVGLGAGLGMGQTVGQMASNTMNIESNSTVKIVCPQCKSHVDEKSKFCPECGYSFVKKCKKCNTTVSPGVKFCPECGEKI